MSTRFSDLPESLTVEELEALLHSQNALTQDASQRLLDAFEEQTAQRIEQALRQPSTVAAFVVADLKL